MGSKKEFLLKLCPHPLVVNLANNSGFGFQGRKWYYLFGKRGFKVTAVDFSKEYTWRTKQLVEQNNIDLKTVNSKIKSFLRYYLYFYAIICINCLQFLNQKELMDSLNLIKFRTNQKSFNMDNWSIFDYKQIILCLKILFLVI